MPVKSGFLGESNQLLEKKVNISKKKCHLIIELIDKEMARTPKTSTGHIKKLNSLKSQMWASVKSKTN